MITVPMVTNRKPLVQFILISADALITLGENIHAMQYKINAMRAMMKTHLNLNIIYFDVLGSSIH